MPPSTFQERRNVIVAATSRAAETSRLAFASVGGRPAEKIASFAYRRHLSEAHTGTFARLGHVRVFIAYVAVTSVSNDRRAASLERMGALIGRLVNRSSGRSTSQ
jgi:hypothetical protein